MLTTDFARPERTTTRGRWFLDRTKLDALVAVLRADGRTVIGPTVADGAIVYDEIRSADDLPAGVGDDQSAGRYRLTKRDDDRVFGYVVGPTSWKRFVFPPVIELSTAKRVGHRVEFSPVRPEPPRLAFIGVRACELAALAVQDKVLDAGPVRDADFGLRRRSAFVVAVQCTTAAPTCFCTSMGTGPEVERGFDIALTELDEGFLVEAGSAEGAELIDGPLASALRPATPVEVYASAADVAATRAKIGDPLPTAGLHDRLLAQLDHPRWAQVADRCITCGNCTLACPTCFCTSVVKRTDLEGRTEKTERSWDSCFSPGFAKVAGGSFRSRPRDRYRQWLTHKFATWWDQFGSSGCVGCGRCITWCPVGIDVREELMAIAPPVTLAAESVAVEPVAASFDEFAVAQVIATKQETPDTASLTLAGADPAFSRGRPGQFAMVSMPGFPPLPISISRYTADGLELTIRGAGPATRALTALRIGDEIGLRGPLGNSWPLDRAVGRDLVIVTGGIGLAPLRPVIHALAADRHRYGDVRLYYGARTPADIVFKDELAAWQSRGGDGRHYGSPTPADIAYGDELAAWRTSGGIEVHVTVDRAGAEWEGRVGVVTQLFDQATWEVANAVAFVCGPERMMQATVNTLAGRGLAPSRMFVTLERHMECGIGLCGHCQMGRYFICRDGPVFSLAQLGDIFGREGI